MIGWILLALVVGVNLGGFLGCWITNLDWEVSARKDNPDSRTAHCCCGRFYYVIPEKEFVREWVRRDVLEATREG